MFKKLKDLNARLPRWAQNGTKENVITQISVTALCLGIWIAYEEIKASRIRKNRMLTED